MAEPTGESAAGGSQEAEDGGSSDGQEPEGTNDGGGVEPGAPVEGGDPGAPVEGGEPGAPVEGGEPGALVEGGDPGAPVGVVEPGAPEGGDLADGALGSGAPGSEELLFYRRTAGDDGRGLGEYYDVDGDGQLGLIQALYLWSVDHKNIVPLEIDGTPGDELLFYRPSPEGGRGWGEFYDVSPDAGMRLIRRLEDWSTDHEAIVPIDIDGDGTDELVFYRRDPEGAGAGWGEIYDVSQFAGMRLIARHTDWRTDHDIIVGVDISGR